MAESQMEEDRVILWPLLPPPVKKESLMFPKPARCTVVLLLALVPHAAERPPVTRRNGGVSAGHPLTSASAFEMLLKGGNAFDAGVAALLTGGVVEQDRYSLGGE